MSRTSPKTWPVADALFVEVEIRHPRERQMHIPFEGGPRLVIGSSDQILLAAELIGHLRKMESSLIKRRTIRPKFRRKDDRTLPPLVAPAPASPLAGGVPTFGFTAEPIISEYADHLPLCRQQTILQRLGLHAPRDTLNHWTLQSLELLHPLKVGAKNSLFFGSAWGGELGCVAYTLIENCKCYGLDLRSYLTGAMEALVKHGPCRAAELTPSAIAKGRRLRKAS